MTDMEEGSTYDCVRSTSDISQEGHMSLRTHSMQLETAKCQISRGIRYITSWDPLLKLLSLYVRVTFTKHTYEIMAVPVQSSSSANENLPHQNRLKGAQCKFMTSVCFPITEIHCVMSKKVATRSITRTKSRTTYSFQYYLRDCTPMLLSSEWAKLDFITYPIFHKLYSSESLNNKYLMTTDKSVVRLPSIRRTVFGGHLSLLVSTKRE